MVLSDVSIRRPVFAAVISVLLIIFGLLAFDRLPLRQYPDIDPPIVSVETDYPGAAANVVESRITEVIEERIAGVEGIRFIESSSRDGSSRITIEFNSGRDVDAAANDIRDRVSGVLDNLPVEADPPEIQKEDSNDDAVLWFNLTGDNMTVLQLTDYAERYLVDRFSVVDGVSRVRIGGRQRFAMRVWLDRQALAARNLAVNDVERALRAENVELPAGSIVSDARQFTVRTKRAFRTAEDFASLVISQPEAGSGQYLVRLGDVARVEKGTEESRTFFRGNGISQVGIGIIKQSTANTIDIARATKAVGAQVNDSLPDGMALEQSYDTSVFIEGAIREVYRTLIIAIGLVILVIYAFLGSVRAMLVPAVTVPVSVIATSVALYILGFSVNLLTLLAMVLAIGLIVDDSIVVLENIKRRIDQYGESPLVAAFRGTRQVGFAVVATTLVLVAVFTPIAFQRGDVGRLFSEFALTMAAAVMISSFVALTLSAMLASKVLRPAGDGNAIVNRIDAAIKVCRRGYLTALRSCIRHPGRVLAGFAALILAVVWLFQQLPEEYAPPEDRGAFFVIVNGPEGATYSYMKDYMDEVEERMMSYVDSGEMTRLLVRAPRAFGRTETYNTGIVIAILDDWANRRDAFTIVNEVRSTLSDLPGVRAFPVMRQGFGSSLSKPVRFVLGGGTYEQLAEWRDILVDKINADNPGFVGLDWDYKETKPQLEVAIDYDRAAELGVTIGDIGRTLETMLGSRRVTTYIDQGEEYDVLLEGERGQQRTISSLENIYVRSDTSAALIPLSNLVRLDEFAGSNQLNRYNRIRSITLEANLAEGYTLGEALDHLEMLVQEHLPGNVIVDYKGQSQDFKYAGQSILWVFILGICVTYLALAAQFESWVHPFVIMTSVPLAIGGGLAGLYFTGGSLNLYSQIGLIMLVGLAAKNGILIVEFVNQLRDQGIEFGTALLQAAEVRLRPIIMTGITTAAGSLPLIFSSGAGAETRLVIGTVVLTGVISATLFTLFIVPVFYHLIARRTGSVNDVSRELERQMTLQGDT
ncbi:efflux RND transporter permease subunit [Exilibacterium tricleocarpae]|uniref:Efflux RND transporter permease subunit n=1 Tax=Exilibacterium tricleocarpae TaxID=2591008 RepID=A0A545TVG0_9GAMM|nr:efflux RND transporter permease subunit [Exilibacterium tricleocarpae]TQV81209.1 efflux RND transporter permease subunit [Exilibacterium tricleocarpae]